MKFLSRSVLNRSFDAVTAATALFVFLAIILGGGGADAPLINGVLEALGALLLMAAVAGHFASRPLPREATGPVWFIVIILLFIALQLAPLPPDLWRAMPGRETSAAVTDFIGHSGAWRPWSLDPEATRRNAAALLVPAAIVIAAIGTDHRGLILLARAVIVAALCSALLGAIQIALGSPGWLAFHGPPAKGVATGVFANPNHQAQLMLAALIASALRIRMEPPEIKIRRPGGAVMLNLGWLLMPIFMAMTVAAQSRAGIALLIPATAAAVIIAVKRQGAGRLLMLLLALIGAAIVIFVVTPGSIERLMKFQSLVLEGRVVYLPDLLFTLRQYWPWGSGLGTFVPVFQVNENLDLLQPLIVNHAHNEVLELLIEGGIVAAALMAAVVAGLGWRLLKLVRRRTIDPGPALAGFAIIALMLLHSLVDYPLRMRSISAVAAVALILLFSPAQQRPTASADVPARRNRRGFRRAPMAPPALRSRAR